jgi:hypothetical protein
VGYFDESLHYAMDYDYWCKIAIKYPLHLVKEYLAKFRFTSKTKTGSSVEKTLKESRVVVERYTDSKWLLVRQNISNLKRVLVYKYVVKLRDIFR